MQVCIYYRTCSERCLSRPSLRASFAGSGTVLQSTFDALSRPLNVIFQIAAHSFLEATLTTANAGSTVSLPESRGECAQLLADIAPSPDHMHWSVNWVLCNITNAAQLFLTYSPGLNTTFYSF